MNTDIAENCLKIKSLKLRNLHFKLTHGSLENIKIDCVNAVVFNFDQIKQRNIFWETPYI